MTLPYTSSAVFGPEILSPLSNDALSDSPSRNGQDTYAESVVDSGQRGARGCNGDCEGDVVEIRCGAVASNGSCGELGPGLSEMTWLRKSVEAEDPESVCDRSVEGSIPPSVNMD